VDVGRGGFSAGEGIAMPVHESRAFREKNDLWRRLLARVFAHTRRFRCVACGERQWLRFMTRRGAERAVAAVRAYSGCACGETRSLYPQPHAHALYKEAQIRRAQQWEVDRERLRRQFPDARELQPPPGTDPLVQALFDRPIVIDGKSYSRDQIIVIDGKAYPKVKPSERSDG
jgi:hypothetical protein